MSRPLGGQQHPGPGAQRSQFNGSLAPGMNGPTRIPPHPGAAQGGQGGIRPTAMQNHHPNAEMGQQRQHQQPTFPAQYPGTGGAPFPAAIENVKISDIRYERCTDDDLRAEATDYYIFRLEKTHKADFFTDDGEIKRSSWEECVVTRVSDISKRSAADMIQKLGHAIGLMAKKSRLTSIQQRQIEKICDELVATERDPCYEINLVQLDQVLKPKVPHIKVQIAGHESRGHHSWSSKTSCHHHESGRQSKDGRRSKGHTSSKRGKRLLETDYILIFFKRSPRPGVALLGLVQDRRLPQPPTAHPQHAAFNMAQTQNQGYGQTGMPSTANPQMNRPQIGNPNIGGPGTKVPPRPLPALGNNKQPVGPTGKAPYRPGTTTKKSKPKPTDVSTERSTSNSGASSTSGDSSESDADTDITTPSTSSVHRPSPGRNRAGSGNRKHRHTRYIEENPGYYGVRSTKLSPHRNRQYAEHHIMDDFNRHLPRVPPAPRLPTFPSLPPPLLTTSPTGLARALPTSGPSSDVLNEIRTAYAEGRADGFEDAREQELLVDKLADRVASAAQRQARAWTQAQEETGVAATSAAAHGRPRSPPLPLPFLDSHTSNRGVSAGARVGPQPVLRRNRSSVRIVYPHEAILQSESDALEHDALDALDRLHLEHELLDRRHAACDSAGPLRQARMDRAASRLFQERHEKRQREREREILLEEDTADAEAAVAEAIEDELAREKEQRFWDKEREMLAHDEHRTRWPQRYETAPDVAYVDVHRNPFAPRSEPRRSDGTGPRLGRRPVL